jgi:hypothetical protein
MQAYEAVSIARISKLTGIASAGSNARPESRCSLMVARIHCCGMSNSEQVVHRSSNYRHCPFSGGDGGPVGTARIPQGR